MKKLFLYFLGFALLIGLLVGGFRLHRERQQALANIPPPVVMPWAVRVATVRQGRATRGFPALALVKGANEVAIAPRLGGIVLEMGPREGQRVAEGELLARLDTRELEDKLASLQAQRQGAIADAERKERDARRGEELLKEKSISESQVDQQRAAARAAREQVRSLEKQISAERTRLAYARILAPFAGVISARLADPGDLAALGKPLYRLVSTDGGRLEVRLPAEVLEGVHPGTEVTITHRGRSLALRASRIFPSLDQRALGRLEIDVREIPFGLVPGALVRARVITQAIEDSLLVPRDTLLLNRDRSQQGRVLRLTDDRPPRITSVPVTVLLRAREGVAVRAADLHPGDRLVSAQETTLLRFAEGDPVQIEGGNP